VVIDRVGFWVARDLWPVLHAAQLHPEQLEVLARARLTRMLRTAVRLPFYRQRLDAAGVGDDDLMMELCPEQVLGALAPVSKVELRQAGGDVLLGGRVRPEWRSSSSSGSTGEPLRVYYEPRAWATLKLLVKLRARTACGTRPSDRVALLDAVPPSKSTMEAIGRVVRISILQPAARMAAQIAAFDPDTVYGLPSALLEAGQELRYRGARLRVRRIFTSGELLRPAVRQAIARAFSAPVYDVYGSSETKEIAWECPAGGMHINADVVRMEVLDEDNRPVPHGVEGNLVATLLVNRAMPLLRYRIGDRGSLLAESCDCGHPFPLLGVVTGRRADMLVLDGGHRISPYALTCAMERVGDVLRYQVTQLEPARLRVRAILDGAADRTQVAGRIRAIIRHEVARYLETEVEFVDRLPRGPRAKFRVVEPLASLEIA
jgi:phenylacetate-CoA ligase